MIIDEESLGFTLLDVQKKLKNVTSGSLNL